jgi:BMFP domain-containing protein YqiC
LGCRNAPNPAIIIRTDTVHESPPTRQPGAARNGAIRCAKLGRSKLGSWQGNPMLDPKLFEELNNRISALIAASPARDIEKNVKAILASVFEKMDLVSRDEFDIQSQLLARTREKLTALEARVAELEKLAQK